MTICRGQTMILNVYMNRLGGHTSVVRKCSSWSGRCGALGAWQGRRQLRTVSLNHVVLVPASFIWALRPVFLSFIHELSPCRPVLLSLCKPNYSLSTSVLLKTSLVHSPAICSHPFYKTHSYAAAFLFCGHLLCVYTRFVN